MSRDARAGILDLIDMATIALTTFPFQDEVDERHVLLPCEVYQAWQAAFEDEEEAFLGWRDAAYGRKAEAYAVYCAARDREDAAADSWLVT